MYKLTLIRPDPGENPMFLQYLTRPCIELSPLPWTVPSFCVSINLIAPCVVAAILGGEWLSSTSSLKPSSPIPIKSWGSGGLLSYLIPAAIGYKRVRRSS